MVAPPPLADHVAGDEHDAGQVERPDDELPLESGVEVHHQRGDHRGDGRHHQPFEVGLYGVHEHVPDAPPVDGEHRHQRAKVEQYVEQELPVGVDAEDLLQDQQMSRRADGQKFRQALYDAEDQALYGVQAIPPPGDGRRGGEATSRAALLRLCSFRRQQTMFTSRPGTKMSLRTALPPSSFCTSAFAAK